ncbi:MAG TPA: glycosyltransferase family 4 protein [Firmicutes bacterium]|nr:glycosyltransferase family 4 protein [Bacillota bacterium]
MRIAFFTDSFRENMGGLTRAAIQLYDRLAGAGHSVRIFCLKQTAGPLHAGDVFVVPAVPLPLAVDFAPDSKLAWGYAVVRRELATWRPDVVHLHTPWSVSWLGLWAAHPLGLPVVATYHANLEAAASLPAGRALSAAAGVLARSLYGRCSVVIAPTRFAAARLRALGVRSPIAVISNGVERERFTAARLRVAARRRGTSAFTESRPVTVLYAGRLSWEKGIDTLLRALQLALAEEPKLSVRFAGDGPLRGTVERELRGELSAGRVTMAGFVPWERMAEEYARADLLVLPSPHETQGLAALEAMAAGLPVVGVNAGALPETVVHGESGLIVPPGNPRALAEALLQLAGDVKLRRRLGARGAALSAEHDAARCLDQTVELYRALKAARPAALERGA